MKKIVFFLLCLSCTLSLFGCLGTGRTGGTRAEITGSILYIYDEYSKTAEAIGVFSTHMTEEKQIALESGKTYPLALRPSFKGSRAAVYIGDCARFTYPEGACELRYTAEADGEPLYEMQINGEAAFTLTVTVDGYTQNIKIT